MNFTTVKGLTIPKGDVIEIEANGVVLWERLGGFEFVSQAPFTLSAQGIGWDGTIEYENGNGWTVWRGAELYSGLKNNKHRISLRGYNNSKIAGDYAKWILDGTDIECNGNIENLLDYRQVEMGNHPPMGENCFSNMFRDCTSLIKAPELPAVTLSNGCYAAMFMGCSSLEVAPNLPAKILTASCYRGMFDGCKNLTTAPEISAVEFADVIYSANSCDYMFAECRKLEKAPELRPTILATSCYFYMFYNCKSLKIAPKLPATILAHACYCGMFKGCTRLETVPAIQAEAVPSWGCCEMFSGCIGLKTFENLTLPHMWVDRNCYENMFRSCISLVQLPDLKATALNEACYKDMFNDCVNIKLYEDQENNTDEPFRTPFRIPTSGYGSSGINSLLDMFANTGGTFTGTPNINTTYYLDTSISVV